jgi:hypothetical protein
MGGAFKYLLLFRDRRQHHFERSDRPLLKRNFRMYEVRVREHPKQDVDEKEPAVWRGRLFLWEGLGLYLGPTL